MDTNGNKPDAESETVPKSGPSSGPSTGGGGQGDSQMSTVEEEKSPKSNS